MSFITETIELFIANTFTCVPGRITDRISAQAALKPRQNGRHFPDDIFKRIILIKKY